MNNPLRLIFWFILKFLSIYLKYILILKFGIPKVSIFSDGIPNNSYLYLISGDILRLILILKNRIPKENT